MGGKDPDSDSEIGFSVSVPESACSGQTLQTRRSTVNGTGNHYLIFDETNLGAHMAIEQNA